MQPPADAAARVAAVWARLELVDDPELDEPITAMGFVEAVGAAPDGEVEVAFRLPTYWCSPGFAFLMAEGIRREVLALPWVARIRVRLEEHLSAGEMNAAVNAGRSFAEAFALRADGGDLAELRETFERKALQRRQEAVLRDLRASGLAPAELAAMTLGRLDRNAPADPEALRRWHRYRSLLVARGLARRPDDHAFPDPDGAPLTAAGYGERMARLRAVRINMEFGGALCRGLMAQRRQQVQEEAGDGEPTLADFIHGHVPAAGVRG
jgi:metal-sulfur cluster biosynthetic enzyme